jgi:hypothetical protein
MLPVEWCFLLRELDRPCWLSDAPSNQPMVKLEAQASVDPHRGLAGYRR